MSKKRLLAMMLTAAMTVGTLTACGSGSDDAADEPAVSGTQEAAAPAAIDNGETYNIEMQIVTWGAAPDETDQVEAAINAITEPEIGVTVTLNPIAAWDLINESNMTVTSGEKLDLLCVFTFGQSMDSVANYTSKNMLRPLNDLYAQYGQDIDAVIGDMAQLGYIGDTMYAVPCKANLGFGQTYTARKDYLDELGITAEEGKLYTPDELAEIFQAYADKYGAGHYPISLFGAGTDVYYDFYELETLGGTGDNGVLLNGGLDGNMTVVDLFETDEYMAYCEMMHDWFQKGYINPDVNTISDDVTSQMKSGNYLGYFANDVPGGLIGMQNNVGVEFESFQLVEPFASTRAASQALWAIPTTCENPEKTMQFLNLLYQKRDLSENVAALLSCGLEGVSYTLTEEVDGSKAIITAGEGNWSMFVPDSLYGDYFSVPKFAPNEASIFDELQAMDDKITSTGRMTKAFGYVFDPSNVSAQAAAVASVNSQYRGLVGYGAADPHEVMPEYIQALKDAGIDDVIAENQRQLDEWLAAQK